MVAPKKRPASRPSTGKKRPSSSSHDKPPSSRRPKANDNNVDSSGKSVPPSEKAKDSCSTDQPKLPGNSSANGKVDDATAGEAVTEGAETKNPWCRLISELPQGSIWGNTCSNSRPLVKGETTPSTVSRPFMNPTVEISDPCFMVGEAEEPPENAMVCVIRREEYQNNWVAVIERKGSREPLRVNGYTPGRHTSGLLNSGDQIVFGQLGKHSHIFQQLLYGNTSDANAGSSNAPDVKSTSQIHFLDGNLDSGIEAGNMLEERRSTEESMPTSTLGMSSISVVFKEEIHAAVIDGQDIGVSFNGFPYYLSENTKTMLISNSYIHLKHREQLKYISELPAVNSRILLSDPAGSEIYQEMLVKALAHHYGAKLLIFDSDAFLGGLSVKESGPMKSHKISLAGASKNTVFWTGDRVRFVGSASGALHLSLIRGPKVDYRGRVVLSFEDNPFAKVGVRFDKPFPYSVDLGGLCDDSHGYFCKVSELVWMIWTSYLLTRCLRLYSMRAEIHHSFCS